MVFYPERVTPETAARLYDERYFQGAEYFDYLRDQAIHRANFKKRLRQLLPWLPAGRRLFEIGCSYGLFLDLARRYWTVAGCDLAEEPCRHARESLGLDVHCADFLDLPLRPGSFGAFCLWDTIEHLDVPDLYLERIADVLPAGGIVALTTGDIGSALARWQGPRWRQIHPPTHLWYFSLATLTRTLKRFGFRIVWKRHVGMSRSVGQIVYSLTSLGRQRPSPLHSLCLASGLGRLGIWMNTFDLMMVVARRI
jgi:SAM-dependent methyltransferase